MSQMVISYDDSELWPNLRTRNLFHELFDTEFRKVKIDTVDEPLIDDGVKNHFVY